MRPAVNPAPAGYGAAGRPEGRVSTRRHLPDCCRRRNGSVLLTWVLRVTRRAATGLVTLLVS